MEILGYRLIHPWIGLDRIRSGGIPLLISCHFETHLQHCFFQIIICELLIITVYPLLNVIVTITESKWQTVYEFDLIPDIYGFDWM